MTTGGNLFHAFEAGFAASASAVAFEAVDATPLLTFAALSTAVARFANALEALGVRPGDRVSVQIDKSLGAVALYLAVLKTGAVLNPLNTAYTPAEVEYFIADAAPALVVTSSEKAASVEPIASRHGSAHATLDGLSAGSLAAEAARHPPDHETCARRPHDLAGLLYTSGTTGRPKGAMLSHGNLLANATTLHQVWAFAPDDVLLHALPVFHVHGLYVALNTAFLRAHRIIWLERFDTADVLRALPRATIFMGIPTYYTRLLADERFDLAACKMIRLLISGSAPLLPETHAAVFERTGRQILERYGMTETGMIASNPVAGARKAGSVGFALPGVDVRIADSDGRLLPPGEIGVLEVKGPNVFSGYWRRERSRVEDFRPDGFFITGDIGTMDAAGRITLLGRAKDVIISGGLNVYPREVEQALDSIDGIAEAAVIGVPHPDFGEAVIAVVTGDTSMPQEAAILDALRASLAKFKLPKRIFAADELPRNAMGKVQKAELRRRFARLFIELGNRN
jgi:malonyl-CoA/methylmalonyl-CoA synthetase